MAVQRWTMSNPLDFESMTFEINPNDGGSPQRKKNYTYQSTSAPDGSTVMMQGRNDPLTIEFSGTTLTESHYKTLVDWFEKQCILLLTDDLLREYYVVFTDFSPKRQRSYQHPWKHTYTCRMTIIQSGTSVEA